MQLIIPHFPHIDWLIGIGVLALDLFSLWLLWCLITKRAPAFVHGREMLFAFIASLIATLGTLYYSEIVGVVPCTLCWYQRAFMYPQVLVYGYGVWKKEQRAFILGMILAAFGLFFATYHVLLPLWVNPIFCDPTTELCLIQSIKIFGFLTIPMMSLSMFSAILLLCIHGYRRTKKAAASLDAAAMTSSL